MWGRLASSTLDAFSPPAVLRQSSTYDMEPPSPALNHPALFTRPVARVQCASQLSSLWFLSCCFLLVVVRPRPSSPMRCPFRVRHQSKQDRAMMIAPLRADASVNTPSLPLPPVPREWCLAMGAPALTCLVISVGPVSCFSNRSSPTPSPAAPLSRSARL